MVSVPIHLELADLQAQLEQSVSGTLLEIDENREDCTPDQWAKICLIPKLFHHGCAKWLKTKVMDGVDCHIEGKVTRGKIVLSGEGNVVTVSLPIDAKGSVRGRGEIGKHIDIPVSAGVIASATVTADIDAAWQPSIAIAPDFSWTERANIHILDIKITIGSRVEPKLRDMLTGIQGEIDRAIQRFALKDRATKLWRAGSTVVQLSSHPDVWMQFVPREVGFVGLSASNTAVDLKLMVKGSSRVFVGSRPLSEPAPSLPPLQREWTADGFHLQLPVFVDYQAISTTLNRLLKVGESQRLELPGIGQVDVTFSGVEVYPSTAGTIAVGLNLQADLPQRLLDTKGTVWITARPQADLAAMKLSARDLSFVAQTDNAAVNALLTIAKLPSIRERIASAMTYDFSRDYEQALLATNAALNREISPGLLLEGAIADVTLGRLQATQNGIYVAMEVAGKVSARSIAPTATASAR